MVPFYENKRDIRTKSTIEQLIMSQYNETLGEENITISATGIYYFTESMWVYVKDYKIHFSSNMTHEKKL